MTFEDRIRALEPFGFSPRQSRFLATAALHSGYCLRRQYSAFAGVAYGKNVCDFLESLVERQFARRFAQRADRGLIYHLHSRVLYRALGDPDNRNRREVSAAAIARKIMLLDFVLSQPEVEWLATESDKVGRLTSAFGVPAADLPQRAFVASTPGDRATVRYFLHKSPLAIVDDPPAARLAFLATDATGASLEHFLADHERLLAWLPRWSVVAVGVSSVALAACETAFARHRERQAGATATVDDLRAFFTTRRVVDGGDLARVSVASIERYRRQREAFSGPAFEALFAEWNRRGEAALIEYSARNRPGPSVGQLVTVRLSFDYSQFGSLPGVA